MMRTPGSAAAPARPQTGCDGILETSMSGTMGRAPSAATIHSHRPLAQSIERHAAQLAAECQ